MDKNKIANKLFKLRKDFKLKQSELAKLINVDKEIIEDIEIGEYSGDIKPIIFKICKAANIESEYFFPKPKKKVKTEGQELAEGLFLRWNCEETLKPLADFMGKMFDEGFISRNGDTTDEVHEMYSKLLKPYILKTIEEYKKEKEKINEQIHKEIEEYNEHRKLIDEEFLNKKIDNSLYKKLLKQFPTLSE